jgi:hypothetical protein
MVLFQLRIKPVSGYSTDDDYEEFLQQLFELAVRHVETIPNKPTEVDMFDFDSDYQEEWDDDETFDWDDEDEDGWDQDPY